MSDAGRGRDSGERMWKVQSKEMTRGFVSIGRCWRGSSFANWVELSIAEACKSEPLILPELVFDHELWWLQAEASILTLRSWIWSQAQSNLACNWTRGWIMLTLLLLNWSSQSLGRNSERYTSYPQITDPYITRYFLSCHFWPYFWPTWYIYIYIYLYLYISNQGISTVWAARMIASGRRIGLRFVTWTQIMAPFRQLELMLGGNDLWFRVWKI